MATSNFYEVRCEHCRTSFPPETKRCIHCGGPLGGGIGALFKRPPGTPNEPAAEQEAEQEVLRAPGRNLLWIVTAVLALGASLLRSCMER